MFLFKLFVMTSWCTVRLLLSGLLCLQSWWCRSDISWCYVSGVGWCWLRMDCHWTGVVST